MSLFPVGVFKLRKHSFISFTQNKPKCVVILVRYHDWFVLMLLISPAQIWRLRAILCYRCWILPVTVHSRCVHTCEKQCSHVTLYQDANHVICKSHFLNVFRCLNALLDVRQTYLQICSEACCCFAVKQAAGRNAARPAGSDTRPWQHLHLRTKVIRAGRLKTYSMSYEYICTTGTSNTRFAWAH